MVGAPERRQDPAPQPPHRVARLQIGGTEVVSLIDIRCVLAPREYYFDGASAIDWDLATRLDPGFASDGGWHLSFRAFAIRDPAGYVTLVDLGLGPHGSPGAEWAGVAGSLPETLQEAGVEHADVRRVILTHLHADHVGWAVDPSTRMQLFSNAVIWFSEPRWTVSEHRPATMCGPTPSSRSCDGVNFMKWTEAR